MNEYLPKPVDALHLLDTFCLWIFFGDKWCLNKSVTVLIQYDNGAGRFFCLV